jgi:hypothetical protein
LVKKTTDRFALTFNETIMKPEITESYPLTVLLRKLLLFKSKGVIPLLFLLSFAYSYANASDGLTKYKSLIAAVDRAEGRVVIYLNSGYFTVTNNRKTYLINTDPKNADTKKVEVLFKYANGSITSLTINFSPAIHIAMLGNKCVSLGVKSLTYDKDGDRVAEQCNYSWDNPACQSPNTDQLLNVLNPNLDYSDLLSGNFFKSQGKFSASDNNGNAAGPSLFVTRVLFNDPQNTGLMVTFKQGIEWLISEKQSEGESNVITFNAPSSATFKRIDYNLLENTLDVRLDSARFNLAKGHIENSNFALNIENNTSLNLDNLSFSQNGLNYEFQYKGAELKGNVSAGSSLTLADKSLSSLLFDNGSQVDIQGLNFDATNNAMNLSFEAGSQFNIHLLSGNLPIGANGNLSLDKSFINLDLSGNYSKGGNFNTLGSIINTDLNISGGKIYFNGSQSPLLIQNGKIKAKNIIINSQVAPYLTGAFDFVQLTCDYNSELSIKNSIAFILQPGTVLTFKDKNFPFTLLVNQNFPIGRLLADIKFDNFSNHKLGSLSIGNGTAAGYFRLLPDETCLVDSLSLAGTFALKFTIQNSSLNANGKFSLRNGSLKYVDGQPQLDAIVSFSIAKGAAYVPIEIPGNYDNGQHKYIEADRVTQYPAVLGMKLAADLQFPETKISFNQNLVSIERVSLPIAAAISIPVGGGERDWPSGQLDGGGDAGEQEVVRFDCPDPAGVMHFYLKPVGEDHPYIASAQVSVSSNQQQNITIAIAGFGLDRKLDYDTDGCSGPLAAAAAIVVGTVSGLVCGACSLPAGIIAYIKTGDLINGIIQGKIYSFIQDVNRSVVIKSH